MGCGTGFALLSGKGFRQYRTRGQTMKKSWKYSTITTFSLSLILVAPVAFKTAVRASVRPLNSFVEPLVEAEGGHVHDNLIKLAAGNNPFVKGGQTLKYNMAAIPEPGLTDQQAATAGNPENMNAAGMGALNEYEQRSSKTGKRGLLLKGPNFQGLTHVLGSHLGIVTRPVTACKRLFFLVYDTLKDTIGWPAISANAMRSISEMPDKGTMDLKAWEQRLDEITGSKTSYGKLNFMVDGEEFFPRFFEAVEDARRSVHIRTYIFDNDDFAVKVADSLKKRSKKVDVKVLLDGLGTIMATGVQPDSLPPGHEPPGSVRGYLTQESRVRVRQQFNPWFTGDHSKTVVLDNEKAFIGGMNFGREYRYEWHDLMVEVNGQIVGDIARDFDKAWVSGGLLGDIASFFYSFKPRKKKDLRQGYPIRLLYTKSGSSEIRNTQLEAIRRSKAYIYIQNPYFTDDRILNELVKASRRDVDVRVILPTDAVNDVINRSNILAANRMLKNGIKVYYLPRLSHVKAAVYDGWACFGSANFDKLSFRVNYEVNLATSHQPVVKELINRLFIPDIRVSHELKEELPVRAGDFLLELVADQL
jgi:phosphatidylserine/phosphatidylglycerophosphate/cardiolipin synthase-like enzyme